MGIRRLLILALLAVAGAMALPAQGLPPLSINVMDVQRAVNLILGVLPATDAERLDVTGDGVVNVRDVQVIVNMIGAEPISGILIQYPPQTQMQVNVPFAQAVYLYSQLPGPFTWSLAGGVMPPGVTISAAGVVSGTPTTAGSFQSLLQATDGVELGERWVTWEVLP